MKTKHDERSIVFSAIGWRFLSRWLARIPFSIRKTQRPRAVLSLVIFCLS
jgi:hypothetical protein